MKRVPKARARKPRSGAAKEEAAPETLSKQRAKDATVALAWALRDDESPLAARAALAIRNRRLGGATQAGSGPATKGPLDHLPAEALQRIIDVLDRIEARDGGETTSLSE